ncbi:hypothetical protein [Salaquimonas pukyongi]|uniref:hypothetical protein n=1 Tax=Salaquimonas pukyongi TaxID=2712698 RepID=UPI00096BA461|nr:hypothetical protein [Salaquimonas pukyongi]
MTKSIYIFSTRALMLAAAGAGTDTGRAWRSRGVLNGYGFGKGHKKYSLKELCSAALAYRLYTLTNGADLGWWFQEIRVSHYWQNIIDQEIRNRRDENREAAIWRVVFYTDSHGFAQSVVKPEEHATLESLWLPVLDNVTGKTYPVEAVIEISISNIIARVFTLVRSQLGSDEFHDETSHSEDASGDVTDEKK